MPIHRNPPEECPNEDVCAAVHAEQFRVTAWHLDKTVSVGHIVTTLTALALFIGWAIVQDRRMTTLEVHDHQNTKEHNEKDIDLKEMRAEIKAEFKEIRAILDRRNK